MATSWLAPIQTFVIFDLEGTGLPSQPSDYPVRIMELSMVAVQRPAGGGDRPVVQEHTLRTGAGAIVSPLPPAERGFTTPTKRPIRIDDGLRSMGAARGRAQPRLTDVGTPPDSEQAEQAAVAVYSPLPAPPRVRNSLLLAVSPRKPIPSVVTEITDLDNELLEPHACFDAELAEMLRLYLSRLPAPVCLVAHNGRRYDFPLLMAELRQASVTWLDCSDLLCADTLSYFRDVQAGRDQAPADSLAADDPLDADIYPLDSNTLSCSHDAADDACPVCNPGMFLSFEECDTNVKYEFTRVAGRRAIRCMHSDGDSCVACEHVPLYRGRPQRRGRGRQATRRQLFPDGKRGGRGPSLKLPDVYERRFGVPPERSHCAADDVEALMLLCLSHGERFFSWADRNSVPLQDIKEMWTRQRGGGTRRGA